MMRSENMEGTKSINKEERKKLTDSLGLQVLFFIVVMIIILLVYKMSKGAINDTKYIESVKSRNKSISQKMIYEIDELQFDAEKVVISGWVAWNEERWESTAVVLQAIDSSEVIVTEAVLKERKDVNEYFEACDEMKSTGFIATFKSDKIRKDMCYEVLIDVSYESTDVGVLTRPGIKMTTHQYLYNGVGYDYNPLEFVEPDIDIEEWQNVFENGRICDYSIEHGTWIYLYEGMLYLVIDSEKIPSLDKVPSVPISMYTSRGDLVPENQMEKYIEKGYTYTEIYLNESNYLDKENSNYFVVSYKLPTEYPILYIQTGPYGNRDNVRWVYKGNFRVHTLEEMKQWQ